MPEPSTPVESCDVLVAGGGPAGIAAACTAAASGAAVILVDDNSAPGGQIWRSRRKHPQKGLAGDWLAKFSAVTVRRLFGHRVVAAPQPRLLLVEGPDGAVFIRCGKLILATGARELFLPFPGWTLPNVVGAGAIQALTKSGLDVRGKRVILAGSGPLLPAVAAHLKHAGADVAFIAEQASAAKLLRFGFGLLGRSGKLRQAFTLWRRIRPWRITPGSWPVCVEKSESGLKVVIQSGVARHTLYADYLACGFGLVPNNELAILVGCAVGSGGFVQVNHENAASVDWVYAVGELTGIGGVEKGVVEGQIAGSAATKQAVDRVLLRQRAAAVKFAAALADTFALRAEVRNLADAQTVICRCEDVRLAALSGLQDARELKLQTRCGMGPCQARICGPILQLLGLPGQPSVRPPIQPCRLKTLAAQIKE